MRLEEFKRAVYKKCKSSISDRDVIIADIASQIFEARVRRGMTQKKLAMLINTKQPAIARMEAGNYSRFPSIEVLRKIAGALHTELIPPKFAFIDKGKVTVTIDKKNAVDPSALNETDDEFSPNMVVVGNKTSAKIECNVLK